MTGQRHAIPDWVKVEDYTNAAGQPCYRMGVASNIVEIENSVRTDEAFFRDEMGLINVTKAWSLVPDTAKPAERIFDQDMRDHLSKNYIDRNVLDGMSLDRMQEPVLFMMRNDLAYLIDGTHRLQKRIEMKEQRYFSFTLTEEARELCLVRQFVVKPDGTRTEHFEKL